MAVPKFQRSKNRKSRCSFLGCVAFCGFADRGGFAGAGQRNQLDGRLSADRRLPSHRHSACDGVFCSDCGSCTGGSLHTAAVPAGTTRRPRLLRYRTDLRHRSLRTKSPLPLRPNQAPVGSAPAVDRGDAAEKERERRGESLDASRSKDTPRRRSTSVVASRSRRRFGCGLSAHTASFPAPTSAWSTTQSNPAVPTTRSARSSSRRAWMMATCGAR